MPITFLDVLSKTFIYNCKTNPRIDQTTMTMLAKKAFRIFVILIALLTMLFVLQRMTGDPITAMIGQNATPEMMEAMRHDMGFDKPLLVQYAIFARDTMSLDFGDSLRFQQPALTLVLKRFPATLSLALASLVVAAVIGIPLGLYAGMNHTRMDGRAINWFAGILQAMPTFWLGLLLLLIFSVRLHWFNSVASLEDNHIKQLILPAVTLSAVYMARLIRLVRGGLIDEMAKPYVMTAHGKGLRPRTVFTVHVLRNTLVPVVSLLALDLSLLIGGSVIVETLFSYNGIGNQLVRAILNRDYPLVQATVFVIALFVILVNTFADYLHYIVDPRLNGEIVS